MIPRCPVATVGVVALLTLGACQKKETEHEETRGGERS